MSGLEGGGLTGGGVGGSHQPGVYVPLKALFLVYLFIIIIIFITTLKVTHTNSKAKNNIYMKKKMTTETCLSCTPLQDSPWTKSVKQNIGQPGTISTYMYMYT